MAGKSKGFVITWEIVIGIVFFAMLASIPMLPADKVLDFGKRDEALGDISRISSAVSRYKSRQGQYPVNLQALLVGAGGYEAELQSLPTQDPWGNTSAGVNGSGGASAYCYARTDKGFAVWSVGRDKKNNSGGSGTSLPAKFGGDDVGVVAE